VCSWPCFAPNTKDVNATSPRATCGPLVGMHGNTTLELCDARGSTCHYNFTFYTCDQGALDKYGGTEQCLQGSCQSPALELAHGRLRAYRASLPPVLAVDKCNVLCLELDASYVTSCTNFCKRACNVPY
jgi:hypothetical protein